MTSKRTTTAVRRLGTALAAALSASLLSVTPAGAEGGPPCSDITDGTATWDGSVVDVNVDLAVAPCSRLTYTLYATLTDPDSGTARWTEIRRYTASGSTVSFDPAALPDATPDALCDNFAYVYVTTATARGHVFDRAPNNGYVVVARSATCGSGGQFFR